MPCLLHPSTSKLVQWFVHMVDVCMHHDLTPKFTVFAVMVRYKYSNAHRKRNSKRNALLGYLVDHLV
jgi:hypothetical protein